MTHFEYLAAGYVLILSFAILRGVSGVPYALNSSSRYGVHLVHLSNVLINCLVSFWVFWFFRDVEWTFYRFVITVLVPILLYVHASLLVPQDPSTVSSWREHFLSARIPIFASGAAYFIAVAVCHQAVLGIPALHPYEWPLYAAVAIYGVGLTSTKPSLHAGLALAIFCIVAAIAIGILAQRDPLSLAIP